MTAEGELRFEVDAALLFELGEQLVTRRSVALAELVKNGYDADATHVRVELLSVREPAGTIVVSDDGSGMVFEVVRDQWMRIATTDKVALGRSPRFGRPLTGAKGVGRFAARKLAHRLLMSTVALRDDGSRERTEVTFDWDDFRPGRRLVEVANTFKRSATQDRTGTTLRLENVRETWSRADVEEVQGDLQGLTPPFSAYVASDPDRPATGEFDIEFIAPEFPEFEGSLTSGFLSAAVARLRGYVQEDGSPEYKVDLRGGPGERVFHPDGLKFADVHGAVVEVHLFKYDRDALAGTGLGVAQARDMGSSSGGVKIYMDGFRVFPYGDPGDDWLNLDADRGRRRTGGDPITRAALPAGSADRPLLQLPGNNNVFGAVFVSRTAHPDLRPTISRERLSDTNAFHELQRFARVGIEFAVVQRAMLDARQTKRGRGRPTAPLQTVLATSVSSLRKEIGVLPTSLQPPLLRAVDTLETSVREADLAQLEKAGALRVLASAGSMLLVFVHQLRAALDGLRSAVNDLRDFPDVAETVGQLDEWTTLLEAQGAELGLLLGRRGRREARNLVISPIAEQISAIFSQYASDHGVSIRNAVPRGLRTPPMREAELHSILLNLLTNALKAVSESRVRDIQIEAQSYEGGVRLSVLDTGHGIRRADRERAFEAFETTSAPDPVLGVGTGLGLTIVRDIAELHGGTARFVDAVPPWSTEVMVSLPPAIEP